MAFTFCVEMLPAGPGDCLLVTYGDDQQAYTILIDGGISSSFSVLRHRFCNRPIDKRRIDLLIVTHVDADHIAGAIELIKQARELSVSIGDVWFNGWPQLQNLTKPLLGPQQGEILGKLVHENGIPWNAAFGGSTIMVEDQSALPTLLLAGGMRVTLLSPFRRHLVALARNWQRTLARSATTPATKSIRSSNSLRLLGEAFPDLYELSRVKFIEDTAIANGSSIAVLLEYQMKSCLFAADAFPSVLSTSIKGLARSREVRRIAIDLVKLSHHGSKANITFDLLDSIECRKYAVSTNGSVYGHPDVAALARIMTHRKAAGHLEPTELYFNYRPAHICDWDDERFEHKWQFRSVFPPNGSNGLTIDLIDRKIPTL